MSPKSYRPPQRRHRRRRSEHDSRIGAILAGPVLLALPVAAAGLMLGLYGLRIAGIVPIWGIVVAFVLILALPMNIIRASYDDFALARLMQPKPIQIQVYDSLGLLAAALFYYFIAYVTATHFPFWPQMVVVVVFALFNVYILVILGVPGRQREAVRNMKVALGPNGPLAGVAVWAVMLTSFFGAATSAFQQQGFFDFFQGKALAEPTIDEIIRFYVWHFLDVVPVFKINETLLWDPPLIYEDTAIGALLLAFNVVVIAPLIATFFVFWNRQGSDQPSSAAD